MNGRLVRDPELKFTDSQIPYVKVCLAIDRIYSDDKGKKLTDFIDVTFFRKQAELIHKYLDKGSQVLIQGKLKTNSYKNKDGEKRYSLDVIGDTVQFLETRAQAEARRKEAKEE